jgi:hypothetical protein
MLVTTIDLVRLDPGGYLQWHSPPQPPGVVSDIPPSANQGFHLNAVVLDGQGAKNGSDGWLAVTFDVPGRIRPDSLTESFAALMRRHESLRCSFEAVDGNIIRRVHPASAVALVAPDSAAPLASADEVGALLRQQLRSVCDPTRFPAALFAAVDRPETSTVICGFDHSAVDALSLAIIAREVRADYLARVAGEPAPILPEVGSFLDYCAYETGQPPLPHDHPGLIIWRQFLASQKGLFPSFPLDLGVRPGEVEPQRTVVRALLDVPGAERFEALCHSHEGSLYSGELTALACAVRDLGGPEHIATLTPMRILLRPEWEEAVGWFVTNIPLVFRCGADFADGVRQNRLAFREALPAAQVPMGQVLSGQAGPFQFTRRDVSMVSHIDYRKVFAASAADTERRTTHISNTTVADDAQFWFSRTSQGLCLRIRHPDTEVARDTVGRLCQRLEAILREQS